MKTYVINTSGRDLVFGTMKVPPGQPMEMASVDAHEFARDGLVEIVSRRAAEVASASFPAEAPKAAPAPAPKADTKK